MPIAYLGLIVWAIVELVRNDTLGLAPKIAFAFLIVFAPFIGSILTIALVRAHSTPSRDRGDSRAGALPEQTPS